LLLSSPLFTHTQTQALPNFCIHFSSLSSILAPRLCVVFLLQLCKIQSRCCGEIAFSELFLGPGGYGHSKHPSDNPSAQVPGCCSSGRKKTCEDKCVHTLGRIGELVFLSLYCDCWRKTASARQQIIRLYLHTRGY